MRAAAIAAGAPAVPPPTTSTSTSASVGTGVGARGGTRVIRCARPHPVGGCAKKQKSPASTWSRVHVASRISCSRRAKDRAEPSARVQAFSQRHRRASMTSGRSGAGRSCGCFSVSGIRSTPLAAVAVRPSACGRVPETTWRTTVYTPPGSGGSTPARRASPASGVASMTVFARTSRRPSRPATHRPVTAPSPSAATSHGCVQQRNVTPASMSAASSAFLIWSGVAPPKEFRAAGFAA